MNELLQFDRELFQLINGVWTNGFLDFLLPYWREKTTWIPLYLLLAGFAAWKFRLRGLYWIMALALCVGLADTASSKVVKPLVQRVRPCNEPALQADLHRLIGCGSGYSFTSSHATNHFAVAVFIALTLGAIYRRWRWPFYLWAASIAYAQVYVGVHYPGDVFFGALLGIIIGNIVAKTYLRFPNLRLEPQA